MLSNILKVQMNMPCIYTQIPLQKYKHSIISHIITTAPSLSECHQLTAFCDANWGDQFGIAVEEGTPLELFKFSSLSGFLICRSGRPIAWK